jgi:hypothetical protein
MRWQVVGDDVGVLVDDWGAVEAADPIAPALVAPALETIEPDLPVAAPAAVELVEDHPRAELALEAHGAEVSGAVEAVEPAPTAWGGEVATVAAVLPLVEIAPAAAAVVADESIGALPAEPEPPPFRSDAAVIEVLLGEAGAPSVAAVRRTRRYSVAVLVARGADL